MPDPEPLEQGVHRSIHGAEGDVPADVEMRKEGVVLEDEAHPPPLGRQRDAAIGVEPPLSVEQDTAAEGLRQAGHDAQHGALAGAGWADERDRARDLESEL